MSEIKSCVDCGVLNCYKGGKTYPEFCLTTGLSEETIDKVWALYEEDENKKVSVISAQIENEFYGKFTRVEEVVEFAKRMGYSKIGVATCIGLVDESRILARILRKNGFEVYGAVCKIGSFLKTEAGVPEEDITRTGEVMCNPIMQAEVLDSLNQLKLMINTQSETAVIEQK